MTYVLTTRSLKDKLFVEIGDSGLMALMKNPMHFAPGKYPVGTMDGENNGSKTSRNVLCILWCLLCVSHWPDHYKFKSDWYHLIQPHIAFFNMKTMWSSTQNYSLADLFNRWWVPGTPPPTNGMLKSFPFFEIMTATPRLPEDLLYSIGNDRLW